MSIYRSEELIKQARDGLGAQGLTDIPIWITESGVSVWDDYPATAYGVKPETPYRGTMVEQAAYVIQNSALAFYNGVERYYHFMLHDDCGDGPGSAYGLRQNFSPSPCNPAVGQPRPAYAAYQLAAEQFPQADPLGLPGAGRQQHLGRGVEIGQAQFGIEQQHRRVQIFQQVIVEVSCWCSSRSHVMFKARTKPKAELFGACRAGKCAKNKILYES